MKLFTFFTIIFLFVINIQAQENLEDTSTLFSYYLKENNAGFTYYTTNQKKDIDYQSQLDQKIFNLAYKTGYIIFIDEPRYKIENKAFKNMVKAFEKAHYTIFHVTNRSYLSFAIPNSFLNSQDYIGDLFDGEYADVYLKYLMDWEENRIEINSKIKDNNKILEDLKKKGKINSTLTKQKDSLVSVIDVLNNEINDIDNNIARVDGDLIMSRNFTDKKPDPSKIPSLLKLFTDKKVIYIEKDDFFLRALDRLKKEGVVKDIKEDWLIRTGSEPATPYLHSDLIDKINEINREEKDELVKMGIPGGKLRVTSAMRTPYKQAVQIANRPVAASLFGSGHLCGASVDFADVDVITNNYDKFKAIMTKHGLYCPPSLRPGATDSEGKSTSDPAHVFLGTFKGPNMNSDFVNNLMSACLGAYQEAMVNERDVQISKTKALNSENKALSDITANMDKHLNDLNKRIADLNKERDAKSKTKEEKQKTLDTKTKERAARELQKRLQNNGKNVSQKEIRERLGKGDTPKDGYWEKYGEFSARGEGWECHGSSYENSRGDRIENKECRTTPSEKSGIRLR